MKGIHRWRKPRLCPLAGEINQKQNIKSEKEKFWRESLLLAEDNKKKLQRGGSVGL